MAKMLILPGIATIPGAHDPRGLLDRESALEYARRRKYEGHVLDVSGETGPTSAQTLAALRMIRGDTDIQALYGFSGGGYNALHIIRQLTTKEQIRLLVVLGAPRNDRSLYAGPWELVYRNDPPSGHMDGPAALLREPVIVTRGK